MVLRETKVLIITYKISQIKNKAQNQHTRELIQILEFSSNYIEHILK